jgi:hypothetical protein
MADIWTVATAIATVVLAVGVWLAWRQGSRAAVAAAESNKTARRQAGAAEDQVNVSQDHVEEARQQALAARRHAETAEQQVETGRKQAEATREGVQVAREQAQAAQRHAQTVQDQVEAARRPLLIDVTENATGPSDLDPDQFVELDFGVGPPVTGVDWRRAFVDCSESHIRVALPLRNVGAGVAVIEEAGSELDGRAEERALLDGEPKRMAIHRERVAPGETTRILCVGERVGDDDSYRPTSLEVGVRYGDYLGGQRTLARVSLKPAGEVARGDPPDAHHKPNYWRVTRIDYKAL